MVTAQRVMAVMLLLIGAALLVETIAVGGGQVGFLLGGVLIVLGWLRLRATR